MTATHTHLTGRHHALLASRAELEQVGQDLARMRQLLAELPDRIAAAEEYEGVLSRHVEQERALLAEEAQRTKWQPPAPVQAPLSPSPASPIEQAARAAATSTQGVSVVRVAEPSPGDPDCRWCGGEVVREGGTFLHAWTRRAECHPAAMADDAARSEQDGSADL